MAEISGIYYPGPTDNVDNLNGTLAAMATSMANAKSSVKTATSLTQLNGWSGASYPDGTLATVAVDSDGLDNGGLFLRSDALWLLISGARLNNLATFRAFVMASVSNVRTWAGNTFYDAQTGTTGIWVDTIGGYRQLVDRSWVSLGYIPGTKSRGFGYTPAYKLVPGGTQMRGGSLRTTGSFVNGAVLTRLPAEARPQASTYHVCQGSGNSLANVQVKPNGDVVLKAAVGHQPKWVAYDSIYIPQDDRN